MKILVVGELNPDLILCNCRVFPRPGQEVLVEDSVLTMGSASAICAVGLAKLGNEVAFAGLVGADEWGDYCIRVLSEAGVDVSSIRRDPGEKTGITVSITSASDRALVTRLGAITRFRASGLDPGVMDGCRHLHVSSYFLQEGLRRDCRALFAEARGRRMTTSLDPGFDPTERWNDGIWEALAEVDVFFPNEVELRGIGKADDPIECLHRMQNGHTLVVAKLGAGGCLALEDGRPVRVPALPVVPVDTTGAGDSFNAGFLHAWLRGFPLREALRYGAACGALSTRAMGGTGNQAVLSEIEELLH